MNETLLSRAKSSSSTSHDAAGKCAGFRASTRSGDAEQTLYLLRRDAKGSGLAVPRGGKNSEGWSSEDKFAAVVLETAPLNAAELAEYRQPRYLEQGVRSHGVALIAAPPVRDGGRTAIRRYRAFTSQNRYWPTCVPMLE